MQKIIIGIIIALAIIGVGSFLLVQSNSSPTDTNTVATQPSTPTAAPTPAPTPTTPPATGTPVTTGGTPTSYTLADVAKHSTASSCWAAINGKVYDLTKWINQHPGGPDKILGICGKDGSAAFNGQHGGQARPASELAGFYIATLAK